MNSVVFDISFHQIFRESFKRLLLLDVDGIVFWLFCKREIKVQKAAANGIYWGFFGLSVGGQPIIDYRRAVFFWRFTYHYGPRRELAGRYQPPVG